MFITKIHFNLTTFEFMITRQLVFYDWKDRGCRKFSRHYFQSYFFFLIIYFFRPGLIFTVTGMRQQNIINNQYPFVIYGNLNSPWNLFHLWSTSDHWVSYTSSKYLHISNLPPKRRSNTFCINFSLVWIITTSIKILK